VRARACLQQLQDDTSSFRGRQQQEAAAFRAKQRARARGVRCEAGCEKGSSSSSAAPPADARARVPADTDRGPSSRRPRSISGRPAARRCNWRSGAPTSSVRARWRPLPLVVATRELRPDGSYRTSL
jgi:hypothetical protein